MHEIKPTFSELMRLVDVLTESVVLTPDDEFKKTIKNVDAWVNSKKKK